LFELHGYPVSCNDKTQWVAKHLKETESETQKGEKANQETKPLNRCQSEFLARRGLVGEL